MSASTLCKVLQRGNQKEFIRGTYYESRPHWKPRRCYNFDQAKTDSTKTHVPTLTAKVRRNEQYGRLYTLVMCLEQCLTSKFTYSSI